MHCSFRMHPEAARDLGTCTGDDCLCNDMHAHHGYETFMCVGEFLGLCCLMSFAARTGTPMTDRA